MDDTADMNTPSKPYGNVMMSSLLKTQKKEIYQNEFIERVVEFKGDDKNEDENDANLRVSMSEAKPELRLY